MDEQLALFLDDFMGPPKPVPPTTIAFIVGDVTGQISIMLQVASITRHLEDTSVVVIGAVENVPGLNFTINDEVLSKGIRTSTRDNDPLLTEVDRRQIHKLMALMFNEVPAFVVHEVTERYQMQSFRDDRISYQLSSYLPPQFRNMRTLRRSAMNHRGRKGKGR
ncbi:MAG: hypothetical protein ACAH17_02625 [Candidatus Paceibacterota bacterium]